MVPFVGQSYQLASRTADVQRSVNMRPVPVESGTGSSAFMLQSNPGMAVFCAGGPGKGRGAYAINDRAFVVIGSAFCEVTAGGQLISLGNVTTGTTPVSIDSNTTQVFIADGTHGWTYSLLSGAFAQSAGVNTIGGSKRTAYLDQFAIWAPEGSAFYLSRLGDAGNIDDLDFASAEAMPDKLVSFVVSNRQLYLFGSTSTEIWLNTGAADFPMQRYDGTIMGVGCAATHSAQVCNGTPVWLGSSKDGLGSVWAADGYTPRRISTRAVEKALAESSDLTNAYAYSWAWQGSVFYCLRAPDLTTTWAYDFLSQSWHEQAELVAGAYQQHRTVGTMVAFGKVLALGDDGVIYEYRDGVYNNAGDTLCRDRTSPHDISGGQRKFLAAFEATVDMGVTGQAMLRYSNDGGATWCDWRRRTLGALGHQRDRLTWYRCGSSRDRVWQIRCTDDVPFSVIEARTA
jgi:hypothetical protein